MLTKTIERPFIQGHFRAYLAIIPTGYLDVQAISNAVREGVIYCGGAAALERLSQKGPIHTLLKPSLIHAEPTFATHGFTHSEIISAAVKAISEFGGKASTRFNLVTDKHFLGHPTYRVFREAGYEKLAFENQPNLTLEPEETAAKGTYLLSKEEQIYSSSVIANQTYEKSDYKVYLPKIRTDWTACGLGGAIRLGIENPIFAPNDESVCDFLEICSPDLVIGDGIFVPVGGGRATQRGQELGAIIVANNAVAHDIVAATILNLDPLLIPQIRIASERGWGPNTLAQIELGGVGETGLRMLAQKTRSWRLGNYTLSNFKDKFEYENPGMRFPFEMLVDTTADKEPYSTGGIVLDILNMSSDVPKLRAKMSRWPRATIYYGPIHAYPSNFLVFSFGSQAARTLSQITSDSTTLFEAFGMKISRAKLRNASNHLLVQLTENGTGIAGMYWLVSLALLIGSAGRIRTPIIRIKPVYEKLRSFFIRKPKTNNLKIILTSHLPQNSWWSISMKTKRTNHDQNHLHQ